MTDLERFFRELVQRLAADDPGRLHRPIALGDIQTSLLPYRVCRRALALGSSEDYEALLLRLAAGEGGFARTEPESARARFLAESGSGNPDLSVLQEQSVATVALSMERIAYALGPEQSAYAPPTVDGPLPDPILEPILEPLLEPDAAGQPGRCVYCGGTLPSGRTVLFCPHCGQNQTTPRCPACGTEVELGWRHCVTCGGPLNFA